MAVVVVAGMLLVLSAVQEITLKMAPRLDSPTEARALGKARHRPHWYSSWLEGTGLHRVAGEQLERQGASWASLGFRVSHLGRCI